MIDRPVGQESMRILLVSQHTSTSNCYSETWVAICAMQQPEPVGISLMTCTAIRVLKVKNTGNNKKGMSECGNACNTTLCLPATLHEPKSQIQAFVYICMHAGVLSCSGTINL